jgi:quercetin dioxygenase-like cupin family protein
MSSISGKGDQDHLEMACLYALQTLPESEMQFFEAHLSSCMECAREVESLRSIIGSFASWPMDVLRPSESLWKRLSQQIAVESGAEPFTPPAHAPAKPEWEEVAEGISCKILAVEEETNRVTMLVRLAPGTDYPPHRHADLEELYLLHGELMIDDKKICAGDFIWSKPGSVDHRVWSETGCTCLLMTSTNDAIL